MNRTCAQLDLVVEFWTYRGCLEEPGVWCTVGSNFDDMHLFVLEKAGTFKRKKRFAAC